MKTLTVRELRAAIPRLKETLAAEHELVLTSHGEPVARLVALQGQQRPSSLAAHRARMTMLPMPIEAFIREERDER